MYFTIINLSASNFAVYGQIGMNIAGMVAPRIKTEYDIGMTVCKITAHTKVMIKREGRGGGGGGGG